VPEAGTAVRGRLCEHSGHDRESAQAVIALPGDLSELDFDERYRLLYDAWRPAIEEIARAHGLEARTIAPFLDGSNLVAKVDERVVVKIFPSFHRHQWESERRVLPRFHGALPVPVPELVAVGERDDGYTYAIITLLPGESLKPRWPGFSRDERAQLLGTIGETMAAAHARDVGDVVDLPPSWATFLPGQITRCRARHARFAMPPWVVEHADAFVAEWLPALPLDVKPSILTGEYTPENLLVMESGGGPRLSGMIDFGDAMVGPAVYDLLGPSTFLASGDPLLVQRLIEGHGHLRWPLTREQRRGLLALLLLHRYSNLDFQIWIPGWREQVSSLDALADLVWPAA
jgi:hygromycin-B 7''-O-kinase